MKKFLSMFLAAAALLSLLVTAPIQAEAAEAPAEIQEESGFSLEQLFGLFRRGAHRHSYTVTRVEPTCTAKGYTLHKCACGHSYRNHYRKELGHDWSQWTVTREAEKGNPGEKVRTCSVCGRQQTMKVYAGHHRHHYEETVIAPTCMKSGYTLHKCQCGAHYGSDYHKATGHDWGKWQVEKPATEFETGLKVRTCSVCGKQQRDFIQTLPHRHVFKAQEVVAPTCTEEGYTIYRCPCGKEKQADFVEPTGHSFGSWVIDASGEKVVETRSCTVCGETETQRHRHSFTTETVAPTCTEKGYDLRRCACGRERKNHYVDALGHDFGDWTVTKEPTELTEGARERTCSRCGRIQTQVLKPLPHTHVYTDTVVAPTCTEQGYTFHRCACGKTYRDQQVKALGHNFSDWVVVREPAPGQDGLRQRTCSRCQEKETEIIPYNCQHRWKLSHKEVLNACGYVDLVNATYTCKLCGETYVESNVPMTNRKFARQANQRLVDMTNEMRVSQGLGYLNNDNPEWQAWADLRAKEQAELFGHTRPNGEDFTHWIGDEYVCNENVAYSWVELATDLDYFYYLYKDSPSHWANMRSEWAEQLYVGTYVNPENGQVFNAMVFVDDSSNNWSMSFQDPEQAQIPETEAPETVPQEAEPPVTEETETVPQETEPPVTEETETVPQETEPPVTEETETVPQETEPPVTEETETVPQETEPPVTEETETIPQETEPPVTEETE